MAFKITASFIVQASDEDEALKILNIRLTDNKLESIADDYDIEEED